MFASSINHSRPGRDKGLERSTQKETTAEQLTSDGADAVTYLLSVASTWAYSDKDTLCKAMQEVGFPVGQCYTLRLENPALFLCTTSHIIQSADGSVVFLCFRGTEPNNLISWFTDASVKTESFYSWGRVHGGFFRSVLLMWKFICQRLDQALQGHPVTDETDDGQEAPPRPPTENPGRALPNRMQALYITGHSLGGAMAIVAAALLFLNDGRMNTAIREALKGIRVFGAPMSGDKVFAEQCARTFGHLVSRYVYEKDVVPHFPPLTTGQFRHFGQEYVSTADGWTISRRPVSQARTAIMSMLIGVFAWIQQQVPMFEGLKLSLSWYDHSPLNYMQCSRAAMQLYRPAFGGRKMLNDSEVVPARSTDRAEQNLGTTPALQP